MGIGFDFLCFVALETTGTGTATIRNFAGLHGVKELRLGLKEF